MRQLFVIYVLCLQDFKIGEQVVRALAWTRRTEMYEDSANSVADVAVRAGQRVYMTRSILAQR